MAIVTLAEMKSLQVGDRLIYPISGEVGTVIAVRSDQVRIHWQWSGDGGAMFEAKVAEAINLGRGHTPSNPNHTS